jgi:hypothetical protein
MRYRPSLGPDSEVRKLVSAAVVGGSNWRSKRVNWEGAQ